MKENIRILRLQGKSYSEISAELGCTVSTVGYWVGKLNLREKDLGRKVNSFTKQELKSAIHLSKCWTDLCKELGRPRSSALHIALREQVEQYGIDVSHFLYPDPRKSPAFQKEKGPRTLERMLESTTTRSHDLRKKLISEGVKEEKCERCLRTEWEGEKIPLELDHIDGNHSNNKLENLRILCYNCHGLTPTHRVPFRLRKGIINEN